MSGKVPLPLFKRRNCDLMWMDSISSKSMVEVGSCSSSLSNVSPVFGVMMTLCVFYQGQVHTVP